MDMSEPLMLGTLVELQDQYSDVYPASVTGARGWVRARREMPKIDPEIYIEWDKTHWRYHGENDGWTYEHHFRLVEDLVQELSDHSIPQLQDMVREAQRRLDTERCAHCGEIHDDSTEYIDTLAEAQEVALESDGFFTITIKPRKDGEYTIYEPEIFVQALTPEAKKVIEAQLVDIASQLFARHLYREMKDIRGRNEPGR